MTVILDAVATIGALIGLLLVLSGFGMEMSAPQQAASAAMGIGVAAIPYFIASLNHRQVLLKEIKNLVANQR